MTHVSHSEVEAFLTCRRRHWYGYVKRIRSRKPGIALAYGTAGHSVLAAFYETILKAGKTRTAQFRAQKAALAAAEAKMDEVYAAGFREDEDKQANLRTMLFDIYFPNEPFVKEGWLIEAVEVEKDLEVDDGLDFKFVIDLIVTDPQGKRVVVDHKFKGRFDSADTVTLLPQISKYIAALRADGLKVAYGMYNEVKTAKVRGAKKLKGALIAMLIESYAEADLKKLTVDVLTEMCQDAGLEIYAGPTLDQAVMQLKLKPGNVQVINTFTEQLNVMDEIVARKQLSVEEQEETAYRVSNPMICQYCDFRLLCESDLTGQNSTLLMGSEYEIKPKRKDPLDDEEEE